MATRAKAAKISRPRPAATAMPATESRRRDSNRGAPRATEMGNLERMQAMGMRAKLTVSQPGDPDELEADRVAAAFVDDRSAPTIAAARGSQLQRSCIGCEEDLALRRETDSGGSASAPSSGSMGDSIFRAMRASQGETMPAMLREEFAGFFGDNLSNVRLHSGEPAASAASMLSARAFTRGSDIYFNRGRLAPESAEGRRLLAHELTHVMQGGGPDTLRRDWPDDEVCLESPQLLESMPWVYRSTGDVSVDSRALYGVDLSSVPNFDPEAPSVYALFGGGTIREIAYPDLLVDDYRSTFHRTLARKMDDDFHRAEELLLQSSVSERDVSQLLDIVQFWSERDDIRVDGVQRTYFDELLTRLSNGRLTVSNAFTSDTHSYLDEFYSVAGDDVGVLNSLIAQHSIVFGGYRPIWAVLATAEGFDLPAQTDPKFAPRTAEIVLERLRGATTSADSAVITQVLTGLTADLQREVLGRIMQRYDERDWTGITSRHGEAWQEGMLYWLYEDLTEEDRATLSASLTANGVFGADVTGVLEGGRGAGEYLPATTRYGEEAATFWAEVAVQNEGTAAGYAAWVPGLFSSLWLPETATSTVLTLGTAGIAPGVAEAFPTAGRVMLVGGTGLTAYGTTIALQELVAGRDVYSGRHLNDAERVARALEVISGMLTLATGFMQARALVSGGSTSGTRPRLLLGEGEAPLGGGRYGMRVLRIDGDEVTVMAQDPVSGDQALVRMNMRTGNGTATNLSTGETLPISGFRLGTEPIGLLSTGGSPSSSTAIVPAGGDLVPVDPLGPVAPVTPLVVPPLSGIPGLTSTLDLPGFAATDENPTFVLSPPPNPELLGLPRGPADPLALTAGDPVIPELDFGASLRASMEAEFGIEADTPVVWTVSPDGVVFATPPEGLPIHAPTGLLPPGEWLAGRPRVEILVGTPAEGFTPFEFFAPPRPTSRSLSSVRSTRGGNAVRGAAGSDRWVELHGGSREVTLDLPTGVTRRADALTRTIAGEANVEVKTYLRYLRNSSGALVINEVPLSAFIRTEIWRDALYMYRFRNTQSVWVFTDAPPSAALAEALAEAGIPYLVHSDRIPYSR